MIQSGRDQKTLSHQGLQEVIYPGRVSAGTALNRQNGEI